MRETDYIVVGAGIAGITLCERIEARGLTYVVIDSAENVATKVAGGVVNPVVLKRYNPVWKATQFVKEASSFYKGLASKHNIAFLDLQPLYRIFFDIEEQNDWMVASDSPVLAPLMSSELKENDNPNVKADLGLGQVLSTFRVDTDTLLKEYHRLLQHSDRFLKESFEYYKLTVTDDALQYKNISAKKIIFAEGASAANNPHFIPSCLIPKKGEYITFRAPDLQLNAVLKGTYFIIPLGNDRYQAGATFAHGDTTFETTQQGRKQLEKAVSKMINCSFEIVDQVAGMRPTTSDRRPVLGSVNDERLLFFNGLGTRGLLMAPLLSEWLLSFAEDDQKLPPEVDIKRFIQ